MLTVPATQPPPLADTAVLTNPSAVGRWQDFPGIQGTWGSSPILSGTVGAVGSPPGLPLHPTSCLVPACRDGGSHVSHRRVSCLSPVKAFGTRAAAAAWRLSPPSRPCLRPHFSDELPPPRPPFFICLICLLCTLNPSLEGRTEHHLFLFKLLLGECLKCALVMYYSWPLLEISVQISFTGPPETAAGPAPAPTAWHRLLRRAGCAFPGPAAPPWDR